MNQDEPEYEAISESFIDEVCERLRSDKAVKRSLPGGGFLSIDRELPFLCVYRHDPESDDAGTQSFASHEAAYLSAPGNAPVRRGLDVLVHRIAEQAAKRFGAFLILEVRGAPDSAVKMTEVAKTGEQLLPPPSFRVHAEAETHCMETVNALRFGLSHVRLYRERSVVDVKLNSRVHPPGLKRLMTLKQSQTCHCVFIGLEILPVYRDPATGVVFPEVLEELRRKVSKQLKKAFFAFTVQHTSLRPHHYYSLGRRRIAGSVWELDKRLSRVSNSFDLLLLVTPLNARSCWETFQASNFRDTPQFRYRPLPFDPLVMKRELIDIPVERIDDPTLAQILRSVQSELDRQLTMLIDVGSERFLYGSIQVYGRVERHLLAQASAILQLIPAEAGTDEPDARHLGPVAFAHRAEEEVRRYRELDKTFAATVELREDTFSGLMVSGTQLLVGQGTSVPEDRVEALLSHEIGTHLVTRHNGHQQPMRMLESGLAGYDPLQEGLAVLAEYLVNGLSPARLRMLAARVVAAAAMIEGSSFAEVFAMLTETHGFAHHTAYTIVLRVFRGGGLTKDAAYLRGLNQVITYLKSGGELEPLYVGKLAPDHIPLIRELLLRNVLRPPALLPRYLMAASTSGNLNKLRSFTTVLDLAEDLMK